jgi:hypothetical protein
MITDAWHGAPAPVGRGVPITSLDALATLVDEDPRLFLRWTSDLEADLAAGSSIDTLSGQRMPGLATVSLRPEPWWAGLATTLWVARRVHLYSPEHVSSAVGGHQAWVVRGRLVGRGPDHEPLLADVGAVAPLADSVLAEASRVVADAHDTSAARS